MLGKTLCLLPLILTWLDTVVTQEVGAECLRHSLLYASEVRRGTDWALRMLDSSTKLPDGLLFGNINQLGNFDECLSVQVNDENFNGKYCRASLVISQLNNLYIAKESKISDVIISRFQRRLNITEEDSSSIPLKWAICVPSSCSSRDTKQLVEKYVPDLVESILGISFTITASVEDSDCYKQEAENPLGLALCFLVVFLFLLVVVVLATVLDILGAKGWWSLLHVFSARATARQLFSTRAEPGTLGCLHGIRVGSVLWILLGHRCSTDMIRPVSNLVDIPAVLANPTFQTIISGHLAVDSFFFLSGILVCYIFMKKMEGRNKFQPLAFYLHRYLRLAAPMLAVIFCYVTLLPHLGTGPLWKVYTKPMVDSCLKNWWINALFVHNFVNTDTMCLSHSWYLAADMQLVWLSPALLLPLHHRPRAGSLLLLLLVLASCCASFTITYLYNLPWTLDLLGKAPASAESFYVLIYMSTYSRATPYLVGIFLGYVLIKTRDILILIPKWLVCVGWTLCSAVCLSVMYTPSIAYKPDYVYNNVEAAFYAGFYHLGWSLGLSWIVFACTKGYGGLVDLVLSWRFLQPIGRLSYGAYLTQYIVFRMDVGTTRNSKYFSHFNWIHSFFGDLPMIFGIATILYFTIEGPMISFLHNILKKRSNTLPIKN